MACRYRTMKVALATLTLATAAAPAFADTAAGIDAWSRGEYVAAVKEWQEPAMAGDPEAQYNLGQAYKLGRGVQADLNVALDWYLKAATQGHIQAADSCGHLLHFMQRVPEALPYLRTSSDRNEPRAQYLLATELFNGTYIEKDWVRAYALMTRALSAGVAPAALSLAQMDQYIPVEQRRLATAMAAEFEPRAVPQFAPRPAGIPINTAPFVPDIPQAAPRPPEGTPINTAPFTPDFAPATPTAIAEIPASEPLPSASPEPAPPSDIPVNNVTMAEIAVPSQPAAVVEPAPSDIPVNNVTIAEIAVPIQPAVVVEPAPIEPALPAKSAGAWIVQLGAFAREGNAQKLWKQISARVKDLSALEPILNNDGKVTRLQSGPFDTKNDAKAVCAAVKAARRQCIILPVT